jgi:hypothetical protein
VMLSRIALLQGRADEAIERTGRVIDARDVLGSAHWIFKSAVELAFQAAFAVDDVDRAAALFDRFRALPPGERTPQLDGTIASSGALIAARRGDAEGIEDSFRHAEGVFVEIGDPFSEARHRLAHAEWLATTERSGEALVIAGEAASIFRQLRATPWIERAERLVPATLTTA